MSKKAAGANGMDKTRLETFSDGVIAILITIMVLELRIPHGAGLDSLRPLFPVFLSYILSFIYLAIYWNNHHHMFQVTEKISGKIMWANMHLLFWLSLIPFSTGWMGENHFEPLPTAIYGMVLLGAAVAYYILQTAIIAEPGANVKLEKAIGKDWKGKLSPVLYLAAIALAFVNHWISEALYVFAAMIWFVPDKRIERKINKK
jgi:uncharacterized membrane protein